MMHPPSALLPLAMRLRLPFLLAAVAVTTACLDTLETPQGRFGSLYAPTYDAGGSNYVLRPEAIFYGKTDAVYEPFPNDTCLVAAYSTGGTTGNFVTLNAGTRLLTSVSGVTDSMTLVPFTALWAYEGRVGGIAFTPGDTLTITVPGAVGGFPAGAISVRTAEPFTHDTIVVPALGEDLELTWTPAPAPGSQMTFSLRYAGPLGSGQLDEQLYCAFTDDGVATVPAAYLQGWREAIGGLRATLVSRVRFRNVQIDDRTRLNLISVFQRPLPSNVE